MFIPPPDAGIVNGWGQLAPGQGSQPATLSQARHQEESFLDSLYSYRGMILLAIISEVAYAIFDVIQFQTLFVSSLCYLATSIAVKCCDSYTFVQYCVKLGLTVHKRAPYVPLIIVTVAAVAASWFLWLSYVLGAVAGVLAGLTIHAEMNRSATQIRAARSRT